LTIDGKLAGINGQIETRFHQRANTGIGLAIPSVQIQRFLPLLKAAGGSNVHHGFIRGLVGSNVEDDGQMNGAELKEVRKKSRAEQLGFTAGDRIVFLNQYRLLNFHRFLGVMGTYPAGAEVQLVYLRGVETKTLRLTLDAFNPGSLGVTFRSPRNLNDAPVIDYVHPKLAGEQAGLKAGDKVVRFNDQMTVSFRDFMEVLAKDELVAGDVVNLIVQRTVAGEKQEKEISLTLCSAYEVPRERRPAPRR
jgi:serine protease Do